MPTMSTRKICRSLLLRNYFNFYSKRPYFVHSRLWTRNFPICFHKSYVLPNHVSSNVSAQPSVANEYNLLLEEFPAPKEIVWRFLNKAYFMTMSHDIKPVLSEEFIFQRNGKLWKFSIHMRWPEDFTVEESSNKKNEAEKFAYLRVCQKMKELGLLDKGNKPLLPGGEFTFEHIAIAKSQLMNLYHRISIQHGNPDYRPKFVLKETQGIMGKQIIWKCQLHLSFPEKKSFESCAGRAKEAENIAANEALIWLEKEKKIIDPQRRLIHYSKEEEEKLSKTHYAPSSIRIPPLIHEKISTVINRKVEQPHTNHLAGLVNLSHKEDISSNLNKIQRRNLITDEIYYELDESEILRRSHQMYQKCILHWENSDPNVKEIRNISSNLPIAKEKEQILKLIDENQVVVLSGETGCGKTTQVPQYILDKWIRNMEGANCNILISQPRRVSAISIAERVACERGEQVGESVGYHVRLNKNLPKQSGAMLFCTTGMLLRKLSLNPDLHGISHVIVDEVHERTYQIDMLLILLKRLLELNKDIRILIMSASFNTSVFSQYFNNCPVIHVPGNMYPVKEVYLDNLPSLEVDKVGVKLHSNTDPILDVNLVATCVNWVHNTQKSGAILCFLPGWHEILAVKRKLLEICENQSKLQICCAHSRLSHEDQKLMFDPAPDGVRKIILATNIAETSITVNDVVYVVDSGLHKETSFDAEKGVASLGTQWITQANVRQRRGRAGRVQHGVCYHLFHQNILTSKMENYPKPEILRMPLEGVILDCKKYCPDSKAKDFLSLAIQPPSESAVQIGVQELQMCGVLDENENLTGLGKVIANFQTHPRLSIALVYASFLKCLDPVLTISAVLTLSEEPFLNTLVDNDWIKRIKQDYDKFSFSDHLAMAEIFDVWSELNKTSETYEFVCENSLDEQNLHFVKGLKFLFAEGLFEAGIIDSPEAFLNPKKACNINRNDIPSILAALTAAFYPNVIKVVQGEKSSRKISKDTVHYSLVRGQRGYIQRDSVASKEYELPSPWLVYFKALHSKARLKMMTSAVSPVPAICLLLFGGQQMTIVCEEKNDPNNVVLMLDNYGMLKFSCTTEEAELLQHCRHHLRDIFRTYIENLNSPNNDLMAFYNEEFLPLLKELISSPQVPFTKGQLYKFVNNEVVSVEL